MKDLKKMTLPELKSIRDLLEIRIAELNLHQVDGEYYPLYTDKEIDKINKLEVQTSKALTAVKKVIREKIDEFISSIDYD